MTKPYTFKNDKLVCQYCGGLCEWVENKEIYGRNYGKSYMTWLCRPCDAFVGCHNNTKKPKGNVSNKELREWRKSAHRIVDDYWKSGKMKRAWVYSRMSRYFNKEVHIGWSGVEMCKRIVEEVPMFMGLGKDDFDNKYPFTQH